MSMRDLAQEHITSTSRSLKELTRRIEAREAPPPQPQARPRSQQQPTNPLFQNPVSPTGTRGYRPEEAAPDMPPRPPPARPQRAPPIPQPQLQPQDRRPVGYPAPSYQNTNTNTNTSSNSNPNPNPTPKPNSNPNSRPSSPTDNRPPPNPIALPCVGDKPGTYCIGATRLQRDATLTIRDILRPSNAPSAPSAEPNTTPLYCKYCLLQLSDESAIQALSTRASTAIAKQHITACKSVWERKAMFKCLECAKEEADSEFRDVEDFKAHLKLH